MISDTNNDNNKNDDDKNKNKILTKIMIIAK